MNFVERPTKFGDFCCISGDRAIHAGDDAFGIKSIAQIAQDILKKMFYTFVETVTKGILLKRPKGGPANCGNWPRIWQKHGYTLTHLSWPSWLIRSKFYVITLIKTSYYRVKMIWSDKTVLRAYICPHGISPFPTLQCGQPHGVRSWDSWMRDKK